MKAPKHFTPGLLLFIVSANLLLGQATTATADPFSTFARPPLLERESEKQADLPYVTVDGYCAFLNAVAATDTHQLYNEKMGMDAIVRTGKSGSYVYYPIATNGRAPIFYVSWNDAARFCNWQENGSLSSEVDSGATEHGVYELKEDQLISINTEATHLLFSEDSIIEKSNNDPELKLNRIGFTIGGLTNQVSVNSSFFDKGNRWTGLFFFALFGVGGGGVGYYVRENWNSSAVHESQGDFSSVEGNNHLNHWIMNTDPLVQEAFNKENKSNLHSPIGVDHNPSVPEFGKLESTLSFSSQQQFSSRGLAGGALGHLKAIEQKRQAVADETTTDVKAKKAKLLLELQLKNNLKKTGVWFKDARKKACEKVHQWALKQVHAQKQELKEAEMAHEWALKNKSLKVGELFLWKQIVKEHIQEAERYAALTELRLSPHLISRGFLGICREDYEERAIYRFAGKYDQSWMQSHELPNWYKKKPAFLRDLKKRYHLDDIRTTRYINANFKHHKKAWDAERTERLSKYNDIRKQANLYFSIVTQQKKVEYLEIEAQKKKRHLETMEEEYERLSCSSYFLQKLIKGEYVPSIGEYENEAHRIYYNYQRNYGNIRDSVAKTLKDLQQAQEKRAELLPKSLHLSKRVRFSEDQETFRSQPAIAYDFLK